MKLPQRLEKIRAEGAFDWKGLASELGVSITLLHYLRQGERPISAKTERKVRELEQRLGLRDMTYTALRETPAKYNIANIAEAFLWATKSDTSRIEEIARAIPGGVEMLSQLADAFTEEKERMTSSGSDPRTIDRMILHMRIAVGKLEQGTKNAKK